MQIYYQPFYRRFGVRRINHLFAPRLATLTFFPRDSVLHYLSDDHDHPEIDPSKLYFGKETTKIVVDYPLELLAEEGHPRKRSIVFRSLIRNFHVKNKKFRYVHNAIDRINDQTTLFVLNYSYLGEMYNYQANTLQRYNQFFNEHYTLFANISKISESKLKNHFYTVDLPAVLPSLQLLNLCSGKMTPSILKYFQTPQELFTLQFWQWLSDKDRETSIFGGLKKEDYSKVNLVFNADDGRSAVINLAYIDAWIKRKITKNDKGEVVDEQQEKIDSNETQHLAPAQFQKLYLKFAMTLKSVNPEAEVADDLEVQAEQQVDASAMDDEEKRDIDADLKEFEDETDPDYNDDTDLRDPSELVSELTTTTKNSIKNLPHEDAVKRLSATDDDIDSSLSGSFSIKDRLKDLDKDMDILNAMTTKRLQEKGIHLDKDGNEVEVPKVNKEIPYEVLHNKIHQSEDVETALLRQIDDHVEYGLLSASDYKKLLRDIDKYKTSTDPYGSKELTIEAMVIEPQHLQIDQKKAEIVIKGDVIDKSMKRSSLLSFDKDYLKNVHKKDMLSMIGNLQKAGLIIRDHEVKQEHSILGTYEHHSIEFKPLDGQPSTLRLRLPVVNEEGFFVANGNKYSMRKQRIDLPIRKTNPYTVALTSYYGKTFVTISQKKVNNSLAWIVRELNKVSMSDEHPYIDRVAPANVFDNHFEAPYIYNAMASAFKSISTKKYYLSFDHTERMKLVDPTLGEELEKEGKRVAGVTTRKEPIVVDKRNRFYAYINRQLEPIGDIYNVLELPSQDAPVDFTEVKIFKKTVPVGLILGYVLGFRNLLSFLKAEFTTVEGRRAPPLAAHQFAISFRDGKYIFNRNQKSVSLILAGFNDFEKQLRQYNVEEFDSKNVYLNLLESKGIGSIYIREVDLMQQLFVDPITKGILEERGEPTTFNGLLLEATNLLQTYHHPDAQDINFQRIRGYERFAGAVYTNMVSQIRSYKNRNIAGRSRVEMSPYQVWQSVMTDSTIKIVEDINPIQNLKESEVVTFVGTGGREKDAINKENRAFLPTDMGVISEATVDSSDVGINTFLSFDPNFHNLRGLVKKDKVLKPANFLSTSVMLTPGNHHDDPKRSGFVSIQMGHHVSTEEMHQPYVRTGGEYALGHRTGSMFCYTAKDDGKVISINEHGILVEYQDGTQQGVNLGRSYGKAEGSTYPHDIITTMTVGQKFVKGDTVAYNTGFFEPDHMNPDRVVYKYFTSVKTALMETSQTHEDSSAISRELGYSMRTKTTKTRSFTINFDQNLRNVVKPGDKVDPKTFLMLIEDEITSTADIFDERSLSVLHKHASQAPRAQYLGTVDKIEVKYHGDKADMSTSLKLLADRSDRLLAEQCRATGSPVITGIVNDDYRVGGVPLVLDKAEVIVYITVTTLSGVGDKGVFANQMKSVIGEVMDYTVHAKDGTKIDAIFGFRSIAARIVESPIIIGTTTTLLKKFAERVVQIYRN